MELMDYLRRAVDTCFAQFTGDMNSTGGKANLVHELQKAVQQFDLDFVANQKKFPKHHHGVSTISRDGDVKIR